MRDHKETELGGYCKTYISTERSVTMLTYIRMHCIRSVVTYYSGTMYIACAHRPAAGVSDMRQV